MATNDYWQKRLDDERKWIEQNLTNDAKINAKLQTYYDRALREINNEIDAEYSKYAGYAGTTKQAAMRRVAANDVKAYETRAQQIVEEANEIRKKNGAVKYSDFSKDVNDRLKLYNATMRINRLEMLKSKIGLELTDANMQINSELANKLADGYQDEIKRQAGILGGYVGATKTKDMFKIVMAQTANSTFSDRIWVNQDVLKSKLDQVISRAVIQGKNPRVIARELRGLVRDTVKNQKYVTERIARSEMARVQDQAQMDSFKKNGYEYCKWIAEPSACKICLNIAGDSSGNLELGVYSLEDVPIIPVHANCRCSKAAWYKASLDNITIKAGALNDTNDPYFEKRDKHADLFYKAMRNANRAVLVASISKSSGVEMDTVSTAMTHVLDSKYDLWETGTDVNFDPSYDMAQSFARLRSTKAIEPFDEILIRHEALEAKYMDEDGLNYNDAHAKANLLYNYQKELSKWKGEHER